MKLTEFQWFEQSRYDWILFCKKDYTDIAGRMYIKRWLEYHRTLKEMNSQM